ncbi:MAG: histidine phosphatase family protein [Propionicimonas sp.]
MSDIYLCRHGRTQLNVAGLLRGRLDPDLDLVGYSEARDLAEQLGSVGLSRVISSPARRAQATAIPIATASGLEVELDERLLDRAYGQFDGTAAADVIDEYGSLEAAPGVEPAAAVAQRAEAVLAELVAAAGSDESVAVVSHDAVIRILLESLVPNPRHTEHVQPRTGCWSLLRRDGETWRLVVANSKDDPIEAVFAH